MVPPALKAKTLCILGSTGSIGDNVLEVVRQFPSKFCVDVLVAGQNDAKLARQIEEFSPRLAIMQHEEAAARLKKRLPVTHSVEVLWGSDAIVQAVGSANIEHVVAGIVGSAGLLPTYAAVCAGKQVSLANKETLVVAGELMMTQARQSGAQILPMDSEHNAIFQCLGNVPLNQAPLSQVSKLILTGSGGPLRDTPPAELRNVTCAQALAHPNWSMGQKISIDSATMMNKGLEVIEARWLFGVPQERIEVLIQRESIVHSMVEFVDGSLFAQLGMPDMRTPIAHCLGYPQRLPLQVPKLNLSDVGKLHFEAVLPQRYPCLTLALKALSMGGLAPAVLNGANEVAVEAFLQENLGFMEIANTLEHSLTAFGAQQGVHSSPATSIAQAIAADQLGRTLAHGFLNRSTKAQQNPLTATSKTPF